MQAQVEAHLPSQSLRRGRALVIVSGLLALSCNAEDALSHPVTAETSRNCKGRPSNPGLQVRLNDGGLQFSEDSVTWRDCALPVKTYVRAVTSGQGQIVAVGGSYFDMPAAI